MTLVKLYYYLLYKQYRAQQVMSRWPLANKQGLHTNAAALFATLETYVVVILVLKLRFDWHFLSSLPSRTQAKLVISSVVTFACGVAYFNWKLLHTARWHKLLVEFRSLPKPQRRLGSLAVFAFLLLLLLLPFFL